MNWARKRIPEMRLGGSMRKAVVVLVVFAVAALMTGCPDSNTSKKEAMAKPVEKRTTIPVEAQLPRRDEIAEFFETTTRVEAERKVTVTSEGMGKCTSVLVNEGDQVQAGDVLAELDKEELNAQLRSANAQLQKLKSDYDRSKQLFEEGLAAKAEYDNARYGYEQQLASVNQQQVQLNNMTIRAPIGGIITTKHIQMGDLVSSGGPAFEVVDPSSYILTINPPEKLLPRVKKGQLALVTVDAAEGDEFQAKVRRINPAVDPATGTVKVTLDFQKEALAKLREAAFTRVRLVMDTHENALLVPKDAIVEENTRKYLFVVQPEAPAGDVETQPSAPQKDGTSGTILVANRVEVETGLEDSSHVEVLSGIDENSPVVTVGQQTLKPGSEVKLTTADQELMAKAGMTAEEALKAAEEERARGAKTIDPRTQGL